ncbi:MAG: hypothetical protein LUC43_03635, partial [Burkholderiales bacterium]|nr:hypothetical protein [Burkholderiales bacterium]
MKYPKLSLLTASVMLVCASFMANPLMAADEVVVDEATVKDLNSVPMGNEVKKDGSEATKDGDEAKKEPVHEVSANQAVQDQITEYLEGIGYRTGAGNPQGKVIFDGVVDVSKNVSSAEFGKSLPLAFQSAYLQALTKFAQFLGEQVTSDIAEHEYFDNSTDARQFDEEVASKGVSKFEAIMDKVMTLGEAELDNKLQKLGVDPQEYSSRPPDQKKQIAVNTLVNKVKTATSQKLGGVTILNNFESTAPDGTAAVGVVLMYSDNTKNVADSLRSGLKPAINAVGKPLEDTLPLQDPMKLSQMWGPRLLVDDQGPVVVAFGLWSSSYKGSDKRSQSNAMTAARRQADDLARAQIVQFLDLTVTATSQTEKGESATAYAVKDSQTGMIRDVSDEIIKDITDATRQATSRARLSGVRTVKNWEFTDPEGHTYVGTILAYSYGGIDSAASIRAAANRRAGMQQSQDDQDNSKHRTGSSSSGSV